MKGEILWKARGVALDRLVERLGGNPVNRGKIGIEQDLLTADGEDQRFEAAGFLDVIVGVAGDVFGLFWLLGRFTGLFSALGMFDLLVHDPMA